MNKISRLILLLALVLGVTFPLTSNASLMGLVSRAHQGPAGTISALNGSLASGASVAGSSVQISLAQVNSQVTVSITGTWSATLIPQMSNDNGANWITLSNSSLTAVGSTSAWGSGVNGAWTIPPQTSSLFRITCSAYTSGTANVVLTSGASFRSSAAAASTADVLSLDKPSGANAMQKNEYVTVAHGATATICNTAGFTSGVAKVPAVAGPGYVSAWSFQIQPASADFTCYTASTVTIVADGVTTVNAVPLAQFFMSDNTVYVNDGSNTNGSYQSKFMGINSHQGSSTGYVSCWCVLPVPFASSLAITITNGSTSNAMTFYSVAKISTGVPNTWSGTQSFNATYSSLLHTGVTLNNAETYLNVAPGKPGRFMGFYWSHDPTALSWDVGQADFEGNFRVYVDCFNSVWSATTVYAAAQTLIDSNGNLETDTTPGTSGGSTPTWPTTPGGTVTDGSVVWTMTHGDATTVWQGGKTYVAVVHSIIDSNGNLQVCTTGGTSGGSAPVWSTVNGATTADNTAVWTCYTTYQPCQENYSGTEDYFMIGFYFSDPFYQNKSGVVETGITFNGGDTMGVYRWHSQSPLRFNQSIAFIRQRGDTSQNVPGDKPNCLGVCYWYHS